MKSRLVHHGVSATCSSKGVACLPETQTSDVAIVYASEAVLNVATQKSVRLNGQVETVWNVDETLCTETRASETLNSTVSTLTAKRVISSLTVVLDKTSSLVREKQTTSTIICGFSDGTITSWESDRASGWKEKSVLLPDTHSEKEAIGRAVTDIAATIQQQKDTTRLNIITCSSNGATWVSCDLGNEITMGSKELLVPHSCNAVKYNLTESNTVVAVVGSALPRHNKIYVFLDECTSVRYCGHLVGHEDWITSFDWKNHNSLDHLASGSQDAKIRLWQFHTTPVEPSQTTSSVQVSVGAPSTVPTDSGLGADDDEDSDGEEVEEGEARLQYISNGNETSVILEALLVGHEERVTSVTWHPAPKEVYGQDLVLISSSMDRSILVWCELGGIWAPVSRVGTAGGILGGSIGSSLLGFLNVILEPSKGDWMLGHGYGGALHFFSCEETIDGEAAEREMTVEERAALSPWLAQSCITGHFGAVTDMCWEASHGAYLMTVGNDQTCRVWAELPIASGRLVDKKGVWLEVARPQVHGYNLSAVASLSTSDHRHLYVSAADEKELRVFDATRNFISVLQSIQNSPSLGDVSERVDRAYIPSLGLSNKATAAEGAEEDLNGSLKYATKLPLERDLGAVSLWPEQAKLFGHNTELVRLVSTDAGASLPKESFHTDVVIASTAKARNEEDACIRLWSIAEKRCIQVLREGHRSTVTALCFSPRGSLLVSSGKDRRLCVWKRSISASSSGDPQWDAFTLFVAVDACHKRIVWDAAFFPDDEDSFVTASRDGTIKIWRVERDSSSVDAVYSFTSSCQSSSGKPTAVTSVAFAPLKTEDGALLAIGLENGRIELWQIATDASNSTSISAVPKLCLPLQSCHLGFVARLAWRPEQPGSRTMYLASCASDHGCRIHEIHVHEDDKDC